MELFNLKIPSKSTVLISLIMLCLSLCSLSYSAQSHSEIMPSSAEKVDFYFQVGGVRRMLGGPGSSPPRCLSKCGRCTPCKPVHVPVPPGTPVTAEYYPEAWRCKCGNKLYMP